MKRPMLLLVIGIPAASVLMGIAMLVLATVSSDHILEPGERAMNKTSWQVAE